MAGRIARLVPGAFGTARKGYCLGLAALLIVIGCESLQDAVADGETRTLSFHHTHTGEDLTITFKRDGRYDEAALKKINWFLRDWRVNEPTKMDPHLFDLVWEVQHEFGGKKTIHIISAYRAPRTNTMLRRRGRGVAKYSQHMIGRAMDFFIPGVKLAELRVAGLRLQRGGVGFYPTSGSPFVHMDTGSVRHWPRMTREQLVRVFPNGRTVHIPTDGRPLSGYKLALADLRHKGRTPSAVSLAAARNAGAVGDSDEDTGASTTKPTLLAKLFGRGGNKDAAKSDEKDTASTKTVVAAAAARADKAETKADAVPLPPHRPAAVTYQVAAATTRIVAAPQSQTNGPGTAVSANDVINARGFWQGLPDSPQISASRKTMPDRRDQDPVTTASVAPWSTNKASDRPLPKYALAYAAEPATRSLAPRHRAEPMGRKAASVARARPIPANTTVALKRTADRPTTVLSPPGTATAHPGDRYDDPWLRTVIVTPSVREFMSLTRLGAPDFRRLEVHFVKPTHTVMMTFANDPHLGMVSERFSGAAVVFVATVSFHTRTAFLQQ